MEKINLKSSKRAELIDITENIRAAVSKNKAKNGVCFIFCPHTTAGLTINENADPSVRSDIVNGFNKLFPENAGYSHSEGNADGHMKSSVFGSSLSVFVESGQLALGTWQGIYFCESDGPRSRQVWVKIMEEN